MMRKRTIWLVIPLILAVVGVWFGVGVTATQANTAVLGSLQTVSLPSVDHNWQTVNLGTTYSEMVAVCTPQYENSDVPAVVRMRNAGGSSFEVRLQLADASVPDAAVAAQPVNCLVMEAGTAELPDGTKVEARTYNSTITDYSGSWVGTPQAFFLGYPANPSGPTVFGQVMSYNDAKWSTFWTQNGVTGKQVAQDSDTTRADELIGLIVFEGNTGAGVLDGITFEYAIGADIVEGMENAPPYTYNLAQTYATSPTFAIATQASMDGNDGGWAVLYGDTPSATQIGLAVDEDQVTDSERKHTLEPVAYFVAAQAISTTLNAAPPPPSVEDVGVTITDTNGIITVNTSAFMPDTAPGDGYCFTGSFLVVDGNTLAECSLLAAVQEANVFPGANDIQFDIRNGDGSCPSGVQVIQGNPAFYTSVNSTNNALGGLVITSNDVSIDGYTQCGASPNDQPVAGNAVIKIELMSTQESQGGNAYNGIVLVNAKRAEIRGLSIYGWQKGIEFRNGDDSVVAGNFISMKANGADGNGRWPVYINYSSSGNVFGGTTLADRNIFAGANNDGFRIMGGNSDNHIIGNYFGLKQDGVTQLFNRGDNIDISNGAQSNWVGGILLDVNGDPILDGNGRVQADPNKRNVIAYATSDGVEFSHPAGDGTLNSYNHVVGNWIGLNAAGGAGGNAGTGVTLEDQPEENYVYQNIIVHNGKNGINMMTSHRNEIRDNWIGVIPAGTPGYAVNTDAPNGTRSAEPNMDERQPFDGIRLFGGSSNVIIERNVIANHPGYGIFLIPDASYLVRPGQPGVGSCYNQFNTFSQNSIYGNLSMPAIQASTGWCDPDDVYEEPNVDDIWAPQNQGIEVPTIMTTSTTAEAMITAPNCLTCTVEVFLAEVATGSGQTYIASGTMDGSGNVTIPLTGVADGDSLVATVTDAAGNTSMFSSMVQVAEPAIACAGTMVSSPTADCLSHEVAMTTTLQGRGNHTAVLTIELYPDGAATPADTFTVTASASGTYTVTGLVEGNYTIKVKAEGYLRTAYTGYLQEGSAVNVGQLRGGDANGDNAVNILDLSILSGSYNQSVGSPSYNPAADFNGDGSVNILDLSILSGNYNQVGD